MDLDDVIYLLLLVGSVGFSYLYQRIKDVNQKKFIGTLVGFMIVYFVSGTHIIHSFITVFVNAAIILFVDKRKCHLASFAFSFLYLFFFRSTIYFGIPYPPGHTNLVQMMLTLKLVGLAFDVNQSFNSRKKKDDATEDEILEDEFNRFEVGFMDIIHYSFNYIGVLTGPYIRYKTFIDYFEKPFTNYVNWKDVTFNKLKLIPMFGILFLIASTIWPLSYAKTDEFYNDRSFLYRLWYIWPNFFIFRMRLYVGLILSECVCTVAGLGAYPVLTNPRPGQGPSSNFAEMKALETNKEKLKLVEYNFEAIHNVNPMRAEFCPTVRETMKHWNMCIQYWLAVTIHKRFPSKKYRTNVTMLVSAVWHGVYTGYYVCLGCTPFVLPVDAVWSKLMLKERTGLTLKICECFMVVFKMFFFSYLAIAFHLMSMDWIFHYYNSIYHAGIIIGVVLYFLGLFLLKFRRFQKTDEKRKLQ